MKEQTMKIVIPADVPKSMHAEFLKNIKALTRDNAAVFLFAGDQKIEHLNADFVAQGLPRSVNNPEHLFAIAQNGLHSAFASQLGLINRYGAEYADLTYVAKLNSKTSLVPHEDEDPQSLQLWSVEDVARVKKESGLDICAVGYTLYLGSTYESAMLSQAAHIVTSAHEQGMPAILWIYPRSVTIKDDKDPALIAGAAGVANALGADVVKLKLPGGEDPYAALKAAVEAAGNTRVIVSGGAKKDVREFLTSLYEQRHQGNTNGVAIGRNLFQNSHKDAIALSHAVAAILYDNASAHDALALFERERSKES